MVLGAFHFFRVLARLEKRTRGAGYLMRRSRCRCSHQCAANKAVRFHFLGGRLLRVGEIVLGTGSRLGFGCI